MSRARSLLTVLATTADFASNAAVPATVADGTYQVRLEFASPETPEENVFNVNAERQRVLAGVTVGSSTGIDRVAQVVGVRATRADAGELALFGEQKVSQPSTTRLWLTNMVDLRVFALIGTGM